MRTSTIAAALVLMAAPLGSAAYADRPPTPEERQHVSKVLHAHGFVSWRKIERDDGKWEVDDAVTRSGKVFDLDIRGGRIVGWDRE